MGFFNPIERIRSRFDNAGRDEGAAVSEETEALKLEAKEEQEEAAVASEVGAFKGGLLAEDALIREIAGLHNAKFTLVRGFMAASGMTTRLAAAKKRLFGALLQGGKRVKTAVRASAARAVVGGISPSFQRDMELWLNEQRLELQRLSNEVALQIKENEQRLAEVSPLLEQNKKIRGKLEEYSGILGRQNQELGSIKGNLIKKLAAERRELQLAREGMEAELAALREQRMAGAAR
ncbi:hypothetical protein HYY73_03465 [Candidatus Woesearchaeota archaeon]|nr:hypothetical protein [Candidatus Woesearchaeota archaeon]